MSNSVRIELLPLGKSIAAEIGGALQDVLFAHNVEFPCGGRGGCKGCRLRVLKGSMPVSDDDAGLLSESEIADGWRLACRAKVQTEVKIEVAQWESPFLLDDSAFRFTPQEGLGVAVDLGTTTVAAQLLDLRTARVLAVRTALNVQAKRGGDLLSRVQFAVGRRGQSKLTQLIREQIGRLIQEMLEEADVLAGDLTNIVLVGNTVMHHLFCGIDLEPLSRYPFEPEYYGLQVLRAEYLGWKLGGKASVRFLPCLGGFVGSDTLAGLLATRLHENDSLGALIDLGTNGSILIGHSKRMLCAATPACAAFEGVRLSRGGRAVTGAVSDVRVKDGQLECRVLGGGPPRSICGRGLVDAVAAGLELGWIEPAGRLARGKSLTLCPGVALTQADIHELQVAKASISACLRTLLQRWGATPGDLTRVYLAGPFGNCIDRSSARRIGLIGGDPDRVRPAGDTALLGAKLALFQLNQNDGAYTGILKKVEHIPWNQDPQSPMIQGNEMLFPDSTPRAR